MRDRDLVRLYWPVELRPAFDALLGIDDALAEIVTSSTQPALGAIKLAWWREALGRLDHVPPPPEPRLQAAAAELLPRGVTGAMLAELEDGWVSLLDERIDYERVGERGAKLFAIGGVVLRESDARLCEGGQLTALMDASRRGHAVPLEFLQKQRDRLAGHRFCRRLRPLTALTALAARDFARAPSVEAEASPARAWTLLRHRVTGRI